MKIKCEGKFFTDEHGRARLFSGVNLVDKSARQKGEKYHPYTLAATDDELRALAAKGMNLVRLGLTWDGVQSAPDEIDYGYLADYKEAVKRCRDCGLDVFVDFHQDLYSAHVTQSGDGAPAFACRINPDAKLKKTYVIWAEDYFINPKVQRSFDDFWTPGSFAQEQFMFALGKTAEYLSDCEIVGYDVFNEPFPGTSAVRIIRKLITEGAATLGFSPRFDRKAFLGAARRRDVPAMLKTLEDEKVFGRVVLAAKEELDKFHSDRYTPFLARCAETLKAAGYDGVLFAEHSYFSNLGIPCAVGKVCENMAFAPHGYDITVDTPLTNTASAARVDFIFDEAKRTQDRLDAPVLVGEWGGMVPGADDYPALRHLVKKFDENLWSQTYWHWFRGMESSKIMDEMNRPYPVAVAGRTEYFTNDPGRFALGYRGSADCGAPTEVYLPRKPKKVYSTAPYTVADGRLYAEPKDGSCVIIAEF